MSSVIWEFDLVHLAAGKNESAIMKTLIDHRHQSLGIRPIKHFPLVHPRSDPGCLREAATILRSFVNRAQFALVMLDWEGSGREERSASELEIEIETDLSRNGWDDRCAVIIVAPELENWIFVDSSHVPRTLGCNVGYGEFLRMLQDRGNTFVDKKPTRPKEVVEEILRENRIQRSSALYADIARQVSLTRCVDRSFLKLKSNLSAWFGS